MPKGSFCGFFFFFLFVSANGRYQTVGPEGPAYLNQQAGCLLEDLQRKMFGAEGTMHAAHCLVRFDLDAQQGHSQAVPSRCQQSAGGAGGSLPRHCPACGAGFIPPAPEAF